MHRATAGTEHAEYAFDPGRLPYQEVARGTDRRFRRRRTSLQPSHPVSVLFQRTKRIGETQHLSVEIRPGELSFELIVTQRWR